jgi:hypothetical protein
MAAGFEEALGQTTPRRRFIADREGGGYAGVSVVHGGPEK